MLAVRWHARNDLRLEEIPEPGPPGPGELLVRVEAAGICGTDLEEWLHGPLNIPTTSHPLSHRCAPLTLGHETVGVVVAAGADTTVQPGTRVALEANTFCGACWWCVHGETQLCPLLASAGLSDDGGLAEYQLAPEAMCVPVAPHVGSLTAVLSEPLAVSVRGVRQARVVRGDTVAVLGGGAIGQLTAQVACRAGSQVVLIEPLPRRRAIAEASGVASAVAPADAQAALREFTDGRGADVCIESSGARHGVKTASDLTRRGGRIVLVGINTDHIDVSPIELIWREQSICGSLSHVLADFRTAVALLADGRLCTRDLISDVLPLSDAIRGGFHVLKDDPADHLKIIIVPTGVHEAGAATAGPGRADG